MKPLAVAWDIDGTLVDSEPLHHRALLVGSAAFGVDLSDLPNQAFRGIHMGDVWVKLRPRLPAFLNEEEWLQAISHHYVEHRAELIPMSRAVETVRCLCDLGIPQACVSNSSRSIVDANIDALGIRECISFSISLDDVTLGKPDPFPYFEACRILNVDPHRTLAVEDSSTGAQSARAAGLIVAGYSKDSWPKGAVDVNLVDLSEVLDFFV